MNKKTVLSVVISMLLLILSAHNTEIQAVELTWGGGANNYITDTSAAGWGQTQIPNQAGDVGNVTTAGSMLIMNQTNWAGTLKMGEGTTLGVNVGNNPNGTWTDVRMDGAKLLSRTTWTAHQYIGNASSTFTAENGGMEINHRVGSYWMNFRANITGTGDLTLDSVGRLNCQGQISTTGDIFVKSGNATFNAAGASITYYIGSNGQNNRIYGNGGTSTATFGGVSFILNLNNADISYGNQWNVVDIDSFGVDASWAGVLINSTLGAFAADAGVVGSRVWTLENGGNTWAFSEATGNLSVVPEPATVTLLLCSGIIGVLKRRR